MKREFAFVFGVSLVVLGCGKKEPPKVRTACVLSDETGKVFQCFEQADTLPQEQRVTSCNQFEAAKKTLVDGECPMAGQRGACNISEDRKHPCYVDPAACEAMCKTAGGTFTK